MMARGTTLVCSKCVKVYKTNSIKPLCVSSSCPTARVQYEDVETYVGFWSMLRSSESIPKEYFIDRAKLSEVDLELFVYFDSEFQKVANEIREQQHQQAKAKQGGRSTKTYSFGSR